MRAPTRRSSLKLLAAALATAAIPASASLAMAAEVKTARLGHSFADSHPRAAAMIRFAAEVDKTTGGRVKVEVFGNAVLGSEEKMLIATQAGTVDFYMGALSPIAGRKKELQIFDFPFLFATDAEAASVLDGPAGSKLLASLDDMNIHGLVWSGGAFRNMSNSKRPLNALADMKGLKVRVMQSPMALASFNAMGMNAVPMAFTEVYTALETHALDGYEHPVVDMFANKMYEVQKYLTITNHVYTPVEGRGRDAHLPACRGASPGSGSGRPVEGQGHGHDRHAARRAGECPRRHPAGDREEYRHDRRRVRRQFL